MKIKRIAIAGSIILGISLVFTMLGAWLAPGWLSEPGGLLAIFVGAFGVVSALFGGKLTDWADTLYGKKEADTGKRIVVMDNGMVAGDGGRNIRQGDNSNYFENVEHYHEAPQAEAHPAFGSIPPASVETYVYRGQVEEDVRSALREGGKTAIVGLHAPGGTGKTELANCIAKEVMESADLGLTITPFDDVLWVNVNDKTPHEIADELLRLCDLRLPPNATYPDKLAELRGFFVGRSTLVIFDDVREKAVNGLRDLLPSAPCGALITSRIQQLAGVKEFPLDRMDPAQARQLFVNILGEPIVAAEEETAKQLMERCRFNPLALEIAARNILQKTRFANPIGLFYERVEKRFDQLKAHGDPRWNMTGVFDLSYNDLSQRDQKYFRALAACAPTGFLPQAAARLWNLDEGGAGEVISRFVNLSLVLPVAGNHERYRLHDLLDEYTAPLLTQSGEEPAARRALAEWQVDLFDAYYTDDPSSAPHVLLELDNLRASSQWAEQVKDGNLLALLATKPRNWLYNVFRVNTDWEGWLSASLQIGVDDAGLKANVRKAIGDVQQFRKETDAALASYEEALTLFRQVGDKLGEANVLQAIGDVQQFRDERDAALASYEEALTLFRQVGAKLGEANVYLSLGTVKRSDKNYDGARTDFNNAFVIYRTIGDQYSQARALYRLGDCCSDEEKYSDALKYYEQAASLWTAIGILDLVESILNPRIQGAKEHLK